ncbi:MAG TPA: hypothetical protein VNM22_03575 [Candidatus Limnocylindrales bacterium]|nr:hypothetical protein [Candidatus Limnocylindrales bacterium]
MLLTSQTPIIIKLTNRETLSGLFLKLDENSLYIRDQGQIRAIPFLDIQYGYLVQEQELVQRALRHMKNLEGVDFKPGSLKVPDGFLQDAIIKGYPIGLTTLDGTVISGKLLQFDPLCLFLELRKGGKIWVFRCALTSFYKIL